MLDLAAAQALEKGGNQQSHYNALLHHEKQRKQARKIKYSTGKVNRGALDKVSVRIQGIKKELAAKNDIEDACHDENRKKFAQTIGTPAMCGQLMEDMGF